MFNRVRWRLLGWTMLVLAAILVLVGATVYVSLRRSLTDEVDRNLSGRANDVATEFVHFGEARIDPSVLRIGIFYLLATADGTVADNPQRVALAALPSPFLACRSACAGTIAIRGEPIRLYVIPLTNAVGSPLFLVTGESLLPEQQALDSLVVVLALSEGGGLLLSLAGAWFLVSRSLVPIQRAYNRQREFGADAAHELRTPLTVLHAATDVLQQHRAEPLDANGELFDDVRHEIVRMEQLTTDLLTLARSDLGDLELAVAEVDLGALAGKLVRQLAPLAQERGLALALEPARDPVLVEADPNRLRQLALILLDNAMKYTPAGGRVTARVGRHGNDAVFAVSDTGPGIAPEHLARLFDRFYRADAARATTGAGLGLAIAKSLADAHGGQLTITSQLGVGTTAAARLPLRPRRAVLSRRFGGVRARLRPERP